MIEGLVLFGVTFFVLIWVWDKPKETDDKYVKIRSSAMIFNLVMFLFFYGSGASCVVGHAFGVVKHLGFAIIAWVFTLAGLYFWRHLLGVIMYREGTDWDYWGSTID